MNNPQLDRTECNAIRGLAIIGIFLHNYCHWLGPVVKENEYTFNDHNVAWLQQAMAHADKLLPMHIVSFFGHYGVPLFLFLSAYGLVLKYESQAPAASSAQIYNITGRQRFDWHSAWQFISHHFQKLFAMMIVGFTAFTMVDYITRSPHHYQALDIVAQMGIFNNLLPDPDHIIWPGPYWFFGLMLQLYIVYRLLLYRRHWAWTAALMGICLLLQVAIGWNDPMGDTMNRYRYNFMGGMLPFGLGLLYARYGERILMTFHHPVANLCGIVFCVSLILTLSGSMIGWTLVPALICLLGVLCAKVLSSVSWMGGLYRLLAWMGGISAALFVCHPITRKIFIPISRGGNLYGGLLLYIVTSICLATIFQRILTKKK